MKTNPLKQGYSQHTLRDNIAGEIANGKTPDQAAAMAYNVGRKAWKQRHQSKAYPEHLRTPSKPRHLRAAVKKARRRSTAPRKAQSRPTRSNPIKWVLQAVNTNSNKQGWYTGEAIDSDAGKAKQYRSVKSASAQAVKVARQIPKPWVLVVTHAHTPNP